MALPAFCFQNLILMVHSVIERKPHVFFWKSSAFCTNQTKYNSYEVKLHSRNNILDLKFTKWRLKTITAICKRPMRHANIFISVLASLEIKNTLACFN